MIAALVLSAVVAGAAPSADDAAVITSIVASALADGGKVDVVTQQDLRQAVALEADKQTMGCSESSCLAEVAAAMGARLVVFGSVGTFGDELSLELSVFDADAARSLGRTVLTDTILKGLSQQAAVEAGRQRDAALVSMGTEKPRILVLDFGLRNAPTSSTGPAPQTGFPVLAAVGIGTGSVAAIALVVGIAADAIAVSEQQAADERDATGALLATPQEAQAHYDQSGYGKTTAVVGYVAAGVLTAATIGLIVWNASE